MMSPVLVLLTHALFFATGWLLLRSDPYRSGRAWASADPWAAHPLGLAVANLVAFVANQFLRVPLTDAAALGLTAGSTIAAAGWYAWQRRAQPESAQASPAASQPALTTQQPWTLLELLVFSLVPAVFVVLYQPVLWHPIDEIDTFMYHVPFARLIAGGHYPEHFGTAYNQAYMAAYPPLFYYLYSVHERLHSEYVTFTSVRLVLVISSALGLGILWHLGRGVLRLSRMFTCYALIAAMVASLMEVNQQAVTSVYFYAAIYYGWRYLRGGDGWITTLTRQSLRSSVLSVPIDWRAAVVPALMLAGVYWANYLGVVLAMAMCIGIVIPAALHAWMQSRSSFPWLRLLTLLVLAGLFALPHPLRNLIHTGNPLFPALLGVFGGPGVTRWWLANRSVYASQPLSARFLVYSFESVLSYTSDTPYGRMFPHATLLYLVSFVAVMTRRMKPAQWAIGLSLLAFVVLWTMLLRTTVTPTGRYLQPMVPLMCLALASLLQLEWRSRTRGTLGIVGGLLALGVIVYWYLHRPIPPGIGLVFLAAIPVIVVALGCIRVRLPRLIRRATSAAALMVFLLWLWTYSLHMPLPGAWAALACPAAAAALTLLLPQLSSLRAPATVLATVLAAGIALAGSTDWKMTDKVYLYQEHSLHWMRSNLPADAVILTNEGRMWGIQQRVITVEDISLEKMYTANSPIAALYALRKTGATHIYYGFDGVAPFIAQQFTLFRPVPGNPFIELLHHHRFGSVWRIVYPRQVLEARTELELAAPTPESLELMTRFSQVIQPALGETYPKTWLREMVPASTRLKNALGQALARNDLSQAQTLLNQLRNIPSKDAEDWQNLGMALLGMEREDEGYAALKQATLVEPMSFKARAFYAEALLARGDRASLQEAIRELEFCYWISPMPAGRAKLAEARQMLAKAKR